MTDLCPEEETLLPAGTFWSTCKGPLSMIIASGLFYGYSLGFVAIYLTFNTFNTDCSKILSQGACSTLQHAQCEGPSHTRKQSHSMRTAPPTIPLQALSVLQAAGLSGLATTSRAMTRMHSLQLDTLRQSHQYHD